MTPELIEKVLKDLDFSEKQIGDNLYEFRTDKFVTIGNGKIFEYVDKEMLGMIKNYPYNQSKNKLN